MKGDEVVLSDVHLNAAHSTTLPGHPLLFKVKNRANAGIQDQLKVVVSRFIFQGPHHHRDDDDNRTQAAREVTLDEDGDLIVPRNPRSQDSTLVISLEHFLATPLEFVGLQVWRGALLLADFILHHGREVFSDQTVLELGAGAGLCSIIAAIFSKHVISTDIHPEVLELCQINVARNFHLFGDRCGDRVRVRALDWTQENPLAVPTEENSSVMALPGSVWGWTGNDRALLPEVTVMLAADVTYSDNLTDGFFRTVNALTNRERIVTLYVALEKRLNFTLEAMDVTCPAYSYFQQHLKRLTMRNSAEIEVVQIPTDFPTYSEYDRIQQLELWKITSRPVALRKGLE